MTHMNLQANRANHTEKNFDWYNQDKFDHYFEGLQRKAKSGDVSKMMDVARLYHEGLINYDIFKRRDVVNLLPNYPKALEWYEKAAKRSNLEALIIMGDHEMSQKNYRKAFDWFQQGAGKGDSYCLKKLGDIYRQWNNSEKAMCCYKEALTKWQLTAVLGMLHLKMCG